MDWPMARRVERLATRMHEVMEKLDVDPLKLVRLGAGEGYARARETCLFCSSSDLCLRWLEDTENPDQRPEFCPNLPLLESCRRDHA